MNDMKTNLNASESATEPDNNTLLALYPATTENEPNWPNADQPAIGHLRAADPILAVLITEMRPLGTSRRLELGRDNHFGVLVFGIVGQRNPERVTINILAAMKQYFGQDAPTPQQLLDTPQTDLEQLVNSYKKADYLRHLAQHVQSGELPLDQLAQLTDADIVSRLTAIKGIGPWTAEQFLFWHLERPDVLAVGDPAVRKAVMRLYNLPALPTETELTKLALPWQPYRTLACHYLLRSKFGPGVSPAWPSSMPRPLAY